MPIAPRNASELPGDLKAINTISLTIPALYNLETCRIELRGVDGEAKTNVERAFQERVLYYPQMTVTNHVNYLSQNMHTMVTQKQVTKLEILRNALQHYSQPTTAQIAQGLSSPRSSDDNSTLPPHVVPDRAHIITIPRLPEWNITDYDTKDTDDSFGSDIDDNSEEQEEAEAGASDRKPQNTIPASALDRGTIVSFHHMEFYRIE